MTFYKKCQQTWGPFANPFSHPETATQEEINEAAMLSCNASFANLSSVSQKIPCQDDEYLKILPSLVCGHKECEQNAKSFFMCLNSHNLHGTSCTSKQYSDAKGACLKSSGLPTCFNSKDK